MTASAQPRRRMIGADVFSDLEVLRRKWNAALKPVHRLPPYEDIMLGSLGRLADHVMLLKGEAGTTLTLVRAGQYVRDWLGTDDNDVGVAQLPADCAVALNDIVIAAAASSKPSSLTAYRVRDGLVETYDVLAMPLANRWGAPLMAVYVRERGSRFELVDSIYRSASATCAAFRSTRSRSIARSSARSRRTRIAPRSSARSPASAAACASAPRRRG